MSSNAGRDMKVDWRALVGRLPAPVRSAGEVARSVAREWRDDRVGGLAGEIAFFGILSLFPALLAVAAGLGSLETIAGRDAASQAEEQIVNFLQRVLTPEASETIDAVQQLFETTNAGALTIGTAAAVWAASRGFVAVINALDVAYDIDEHRSYVRLRALALGLALGTLAVVTVMLGMLVLGPLLGSGQEVAERVGLGSVFATLWDWARWPITVAVMALWAATVFHVGPNHRTAWRWELPGAALTTIAWIAVSLGFRAYLSIATGANNVLGTLGGALIVLLWLYLLAIGLLLGAELNAVLVRRHAVPQRPRAGLHRLARLAPAARRRS